MKKNRLNLCFNIIITVQLLKYIYNTNLRKNDAHLATAAIDKVFWSPDPSTSTSLLNSVESPYTELARTSSLAIHKTHSYGQEHSCRDKTGKLYAYYIHTY